MTKVLQSRRIKLSECTQDFFFENFIKQPAYQATLPFKKILASAKTLRKALGPILLTDRLWTRGSPNVLKLIISHCNIQRYVFLLLHITY